MPAGQRSRYGWRLASVGGIPVFIGRSWPIIAIVIVVTFGPQVTNPTTFERGGSFGFAVALAYALVLLFSVLAHEAAHAVTARRLGHRVDRVVADLWGGHTVYDGGRPRPGASAAIAVVGPVANLAIAGVGYGLQGVFPDGFVGLLLSALTLSNLFVGVFNLLPGLPLDGGFIVDALVWKVTGDRNKGMISAGWLGRILTVTVILIIVGLPLLRGQQPSLYTIVYCGLIGAFMWAGATGAIRAGSSGRRIARVPLARVLRPIALAGVGESIAQAMSRIGPLPGAVIALDPSGRPVGVVDIGAANAVDAAHRAGVSVSSVVARQPEGWVVVADPMSDVSGVVSAIVARVNEPDGMPKLVLVTDAGGRLLGTVSLDDLDAALGG